MALMIPPSHKYVKAKHLWVDSPVLLHLCRTTAKRRGWLIILIEVSKFPLFFPVIQDYPRFWKLSPFKPLFKRAFLISKFLMISN